MTQTAHSVDLIQHAVDECLAQVQHAVVVVGYSGGLDSSVLLHACSQSKWLEKNKLEIQAIHVNHGLNQQADQWQQHCQQICNQFGITLFSQKIKLEQQGSIEQAARKARYNVFAQHLVDQQSLLLAHHQDDQIETFMQRLMRGSGLTGLMAMAKQRKLPLDKQRMASIERPLLAVDKHALFAYAQHFSLTYVHDTSNDSNEFDRNFWRNDILPQLEKRYPQYKQSIHATMESLRTEQQSLHWFLNEALDLAITPQGGLSIDVLSRYPAHVMPQLIRHWLVQEDIYPLPTHMQLQQCIDDVICAKQDASPIFAWSHHKIGRYQQVLYRLPSFVSQPVDESLGNTVFNGEPISLPIGQLYVEKPRGKDNLVAGLKPGQYDLVFTLPEGKIKPHNRPSKSYKKLMQEAHVPPWLRSYWPILLKDGNIACIPGICICEGFFEPNGWQVILDTGHE